MRKQTHKVELTSEERQTLETLVRKGEHSALKLMRAHILLKADRNGPQLDGCENLRGVWLRCANCLQCSQTVCHRRETRCLGTQTPKSTLSRAET